MRRRPRCTAACPGTRRPASPTCAATTPGDQRALAPGVGAAAGVGVPPLSGSEDFNLATQPTTADGFPMKPHDATVGVDDLHRPRRHLDRHRQRPGPAQRHRVAQGSDARRASSPRRARPRRPIQLALIDAVRAAALPLRDPRRRARSGGRIDHVDPRPTGTSTTPRSPPTTSPG